MSLFPLVANSKTPALDWMPYQSARPSPNLVATWRAQPGNTGIATGMVSGVVVLDCDNMLARVEAETRGIPDTFTVTTPRGTHFYFAHPGWPCTNRAGRRWTSLSDDPATQVVGWDLRGDGGYVVGPGSHYVPTPFEASKGKVEGDYAIERDVPVAPAPEWLLQLMAPREHKPNVPIRITDTTTTYGRKCLDSEIAVLTSAQPGGINEQINLSAFAIGQLVAGGEISTDDGWNELCDALEVLGVANDGKAPGTLERGWSAGMGVPRGVEHKTPVTPAEALGTRDAPPPPPTATDYVHPTTGRILSLTAKEAEDKGNHLAVEYWLTIGTGHDVRYDEFRAVVLLNGEPLTDHTERAAWLLVREVSGVRFAKELFSDVVRNVAYTNRFHPLRQYLDATEPQWDGTPRLDTWMITHLGCEDTPYIRAIGAIFLTAAVRRARQPGVKFDEIIVLEGPQGTEKSTAVSLLAPDTRWFSDDINVSMTSRELLEATEGKWIVEAPELSKLRDAEIEHIKHTLSRRFDRARKAYDRNPTEQGRQWIAFGTTNAPRYLSDPTGNRRFWPAKIGRVCLADILRDRQQLWAEAAQRESSGASIRLDESLWQAAADEQDERVLVDPIAAALEPVFGEYEHGRVLTKSIWEFLRIPLDRQTALGRKMSDAMNRLGWTHKRQRVAGVRQYVFVKGQGLPEILYDHTGNKFIHDRAKLEVVS